MQEMREIPVIINEKISDLVHYFKKFNALKIILKIHKKSQTDPGLILTQGNVLVAQYIYARNETNPRNSH